MPQLAGLPLFQSLETYRIIGKNIRCFREEVPITQAELALYLGICFNTMSRIESGYNRSEYALIKSIAELFGTTSDVLATVDGYKKLRTPENLEAVRLIFEHFKSLCFPQAFSLFNNTDPLFDLIPQKFLDKNIAEKKGKPVGCLSLSSVNIYEKNNNILRNSYNWQWRSRQYKKEGNGVVKIKQVSSAVPSEAVPIVRFMQTRSCTTSQDIVDFIEKAKLRIN